MKSVWVVCLFAILVNMTALAQSNPVPFISQPLVPTSVAPGGPAFTLTISGAGFLPSSLVNWNGSPLLTTVVSSTKLSARVSASRIANEGTASITVVNPGTQPSNIILFSVSGSAPALAFSEGQVPQSLGGYVIAGTFDGDNIQDLLTGGRLLKGNGDGTFANGVTSNCGGNLAAADFNRDGKLDLISGFGDSNYAAYTVCLGKGNGKFAPLTSVPTDQVPVYFQSGDFNGDGLLDVAMDMYHYSWAIIDGAIQIWLGNGDGTFVLKSITNLDRDTDNESTSDAIGDFNGDGFLDVAASMVVHNDVAIMLGNGDGTLQPPVFYPVGLRPEYIAIADFNGDGKQDLAVTNYLGNTFSVLLGNGDGTFQSNVDYETGPTPKQIVVADLDRDGKLDLAIANSADFDLTDGTGSISILLGKGDGTFQNRIDFGADRFFYLTVADFNGDGRLDLFSGLSIFLQGSDEPNVDLSPTRLKFEDQDVGSSSPPQTVTLTNTGTGALVISGISFAGANPGDFTQTNDCGTGVAGGGSCTIEVSFAPTATGARAATLQVTDNAPGSPQSVTLTGTGVAPAVILSPTSLTFPTTVLNVVSASQTVTLTNTGTGPLTHISIAVQGDFLEQNNCGTSVAVGGSCTITVQFKPLHKDTRTGSVVVTDNAPDSPQSVALSGVGTVVQLSAIGINFGNQRVGTSKASSIKLTNVRDQPLTIFGITIDGANPGDFSQVNTCGSSVPAHGSCKIRVTFTPTVQGSRSATLEFSDDGGGSPQSVALSGNGT